jgi:hypothetical protein
MFMEYDLGTVKELQGPVMVAAHVNKHTVREETHGAHG